jgi:hypothetical protein
MGTLTFTLRDYSDELTIGAVRVADQAGIDVWSVVDGLGDALNTHVAAHSTGTVTKLEYRQGTQSENDIRPADPWAQREIGFRFYLTDDVNFQKSFFTIGTADLDIGSVVAGQDELDLTAAPTAAFVAWIEANVLSADGNAVTVDRAVIIGRSS